jgi:hypothetical protein
MSVRGHHGLMFAEAPSEQGDDGGAPDTSPGTVVALINDFGALGSTDVIDATGKIWTLVGNASVVDEFNEVALGRKVLAFYGPPDAYLENSDSMDWEFGSDDFTLEGYIYRTAGTVYPLTKFVDMYGYDLIRTYWGDSVFNFEVCMQVDGNWHGIYQAPVGFPSQQLTHWALVRDGDTLRAYLSGREVAAAVIGPGAQYPMDAVARISYSPIGNSGFEGYLAAFRAKKGGCRYPGGTSFIPPPLPWTS